MIASNHSHADDLLFALNGIALFFQRPPGLPLSFWEVQTLYLDLALLAKKAPVDSAKTLRQVYLSARYPKLVDDPLTQQLENYPDTPLEVPSLIDPVLKELQSALQSPLQQNGIKLPPSYVPATKPRKTGESLSMAPSVAELKGLVDPLVSTMIAHGFHPPGLGKCLLIIQGILRLWAIDPRPSCQQCQGFLLQQGALLHMLMQAIGALLLPQKNGALLSLPAEGVPPQLTKLAGLIQPHLTPSAWRKDELIQTATFFDTIFDETEKELLPALRGWRTRLLQCKDMDETIQIEIASEGWFLKHVYAKAIKELFPVAKALIIELKKLLDDKNPNQGYPISHGC